MKVDASIRELAENPNVHQPLTAGRELLTDPDGRFAIYLAAGNGARSATVQRVRLSDDDVADAVEEIRAILRARGRAGSPEIDNVRAVLEWALGQDAERGLRLATWLEAFWVVRDPAEGASWLEQFLAATPAAEPELRGHAWRALDMIGEHERAATCYPTSLELLTATGNKAHVAHMRFRIAASMVIRGETEAAWPLLEDVLQESRLRGDRLGECQALAYLAERAEGRGDHASALGMTLESAAISHEVGWAWWESYQLRGAAELEREKGNLGAAERHALRALDLSLGLGDDRTSVFAAAELAIIAAAGDDSARAGLLWGAIETELSAGRLGGRWEQHVEEFEASVQRADGPVFQRACAEGRLLSIAQAAGLKPV